MALQLLADYYGTKELPFRPLEFCKELHEAHGAIRESELW
jgi:hypothetical protein